MSKNPENNFKVPKVIGKQSNFSGCILKNYEETISIGEELLKVFPSIKLLLLEGPLGVGKTSLVKGIAKYLKIQEPITSPSFPLSQHYLFGEQPLIHLDLYRLDKGSGANELFLQEEEEANSLKALIVIEWPERLTIRLQEAWRIQLKYLESGERFLNLQRPS